MEEWGNWVGRGKAEGGERCQIPRESESVSRKLGRATRKTHCWKVIEISLMGNQRQNLPVTSRSFSEIGRAHV